MTASATDCQSCQGLHQCRYQGYHPGYYDTPQGLTECPHHITWRHNRRMENQAAASHLPRQHQTATFRDFTVTADNAPALKAVIAAVESAANLYITGDSGTGKTLLVSILGNELLRRGKSVLYITAPELLLSLRYNTEQSEPNLRRYQTVEALIIEDLGTERPTEYSGEQLAMVLEGRRRNSLQTVLTSQDPPAVISQRYQALGMRRVGQLLNYHEILKMKH